MFKLHALTILLEIKNIEKYSAEKHWKIMSYGLRVRNCVLSIVFDY